MYMHATGIDGAPVAALHSAASHSTPFVMGPKPAKTIILPPSHTLTHTHTYTDICIQKAYASLSNNVASPIRNGRKPAGREALAAMSMVGAAAE